MNDVDVESNLVWENGEDFTFNNINPCGFCNENSEAFDYVMIQPWDGGWSFSSQWNSRKYIVEVPCNSSMMNLNLSQSFTSTNNSKDGIHLEKLMPNPATEQVQIQINSTIESNIQVQIFDLFGRIVLRKVN